MKVLLLILSFAIVGCAAYERSEEAERAKSRMVGLRDDQVRQCAGRPTAIERRGAVEVWKYESGGEDVRRGERSSVLGAGLSGLTPGANPIPTRYCLVQLFFENRRVTRVRYAGTTGGVFSQGEQCAFVVANCAK